MRSGAWGIGRLSRGARRARLAWAAALCLAGAWAKAEEIQVVKSGRVFGKADAYRVEDATYLALKDAALIYDAKASYYGVSKRVTLSLRGRKAVFRVGGSEALLGDKKIEMPQKVLMRQDRAYLPMALLESPEFSEFTGLDARFDGKARLLSLEERSNAGPLRWFTHPDHTRIVLELRDGLAFKTEKRGLRAVEISIPRGVIDAARDETVSDGAVESVHLGQDSRQALLSVILADESRRWKVREFDNPRRLVLDVARPSGAAGPKAAAKAAQESVSEPPAVSTAPPVLAAPPAEAADHPLAASTAAAAGERAAPATGPRAALPQRKIRVAIDPGHGGRDSGAVGRRRTLEKNINLLLAQELARALEEAGHFDVLLTRSTDVLVPLSDRAKLANEWAADIFISIHCNAHRVRSEHGYEIYFLSEQASDPEAERLAEFENSVLSLEEKTGVEDEAAGVLYQLARTEFINDASELSGLMVRALGRSVDLTNRGVKQASFYVLRGANEPAVLVEAAFVTNAKDEAKLDSKRYRRSIVKGLQEGILEFAKRKGMLPPRSGGRDGR